MAKLKAHGAELFRIQMGGFDKAYMADGTILKNYGSGWKLAGRLKPGVNPVEHAEKQRRFYAEVTPERALRAAYREKIVSSFSSLEARARAHCLIELMTGDPDGCWSEFNDRDPDHNLSLEEWVDLHRVYQAALAEGKAAKSRRIELLDKA